MALNCPPNCISGTPLWSLYDVTDNNPEYCLFESVVMEYTDIAGFPVMYYRAKSKMDKLYGEDPNQNYYEPIKTKLYYEPTEEKNIIDALGIRSDETIQYSLIPKGTFSRDIGESTSGVPDTVINAVGGTGYTSGFGVLTTGGSGTGLRVDITANAVGNVTKITINSFNRGDGYQVGDVITITGGGGNATFEIGSITTKPIQPMPGDVIKTLWNNRNYEIVDIGAEESIFQARKLIWEFILRPFRFSEQSLMSESIHTSKVVWNYIYIYPDGLFADITYSDGTVANGVPVDQLDLDTAGMACGVKYKRNDDGSFDIMQEALVGEANDGYPEEELVPGDGVILNNEYQDTGKPVKDRTSNKYGDDSWIEVESEKIDNYGDVDTKIFGY